MATRELPVLQPAPNLQVSEIAPKKIRLRYDCSKCPAYCCSYDWIPVTRRDIQRLGKRFGLTYEEAESKFTRYEPEYKRRILLHRKDHIYKSTCQFLHKTKRGCTVYEHRPAICRQYPEETTCGYYTFLTWERKHQHDPDFVPMQRT